MIDKCYVIPVQNKCNCNCVFCISKTRNYDKEQEFLKCDNKFKDNIKLLKKRGIRKFEITGGGEPFLNKNLKDIVNSIKDIIPDSYIKLYTNGFILKYAGNIDELDISVVSDDSEVNLKYMLNKSRLRLMEKLKYFRKVYPTIKIRLSVALIKGAIDSRNKLDTFIQTTNKYVDEYVVRTLYPHTPNREELFVDFEYENEKVVMERENDVKCFDGLILWSDNEFYKNWYLKEKRILYSYILLKPDSKTYIKEIENFIYSKGFSIKQILHTNRFVEYSKGLYKDKDEEYFKIVERHLENVSYLFGNEGIVFILDKDCDMERLVKETYELKLEIRNKYSFTHNKKGYLKIEDNISHLNIVHCPDPNCKLFDRDINYLMNAKHTVINSKKYEDIKRYRSYTI